MRVPRVRLLRLSVLSDRRPKARGRAAVVAPGSRRTPRRQARADDSPAAALWDGAPREDECSSPGCPRRAPQAIGYDDRVPVHGISDPAPAPSYADVRTTGSSQLLPCPAAEWRHAQGYRVVLPRAPARVRPHNGLSHHL